VKRNSTLDFLRFIGVILTMFSHLVVSGNSLPEKVASVIQNGGWVGVDLFFVLSGFLVSGLIFKELSVTGGFRSKTFLIRRGFKIYPAFYLFLGITWGMTIWFQYSSRESNINYLIQAVFFSNYLPGTLQMHGWLWSVCVEEHFYIFLCILFPVLIMFKRVNFKALLFVYLFFFITGLCFRLYNLRYPEFDFYSDAARSHLRFDALFYGVFLRYLYNNGYLKKWKSNILLALAIAGTAIPFLFDIDSLTEKTSRLLFALLLSFNPLIFGYIMIRMYEVDWKWIKPFAYIGKYSYSIYLFHGLINNLTQGFFTGWKYYIVYFAGSLIGGIIISKMIEYPFLAIRDRWFPGISRGKREGAFPAGVSVSAPVSVSASVSEKITHV